MPQLVLNFISISFFATRDYQDGYQVDKGQFEEVLLVNEIRKLRTPKQAILKICGTEISILSFYGKIGKFKFLGFSGPFGPFLILIFKDGPKFKNLRLSGYESHFWVLEGHLVHF